MATFNRRQALVGGTALLGLPLLRTETHAPAPNWGRIANSSWRDQRIYGGLLFAGPPNPNSFPLYTRHPLDEDRLDWTDADDIRFALRQFASAGLNTIKLSYWGHRGETDRSGTALMFSQRRWPGDGEGTYTEAEQIAKARQLFAIAAELRLLIAPMLEVSPDFRFWEEFPNNLDNLVERATWVLKHFGDAPNYLRVYDRDGRPRHVVWLIETIHVGPVDPPAFAAGFDRAASRLQDRLGLRVGFEIDTTPLPPYGSHDGPDPAALKTTSSLLGINPFNITSQGPGAREDQEDITEDERLAYARSIMQKWSGSGIPFLAPVLPGFDDRRLLRPDIAVYGFNANWRKAQRNLALEFGGAGLTVDTWNGWTEGYAIPPSVEDGDVHLSWLKDTVADHRNRWSTTGNHGVPR